MVMAIRFNCLDPQQVLSAGPQELAIAIRGMMEGWEVRRLLDSATEYPLSTSDGPGRHLEQAVDEVIAASDDDAIDRAFVVLADTVWSSRMLRRLTWPTYFLSRFRMAVDLTFFDAMHLVIGAELGTSIRGDELSELVAATAVTTTHVWVPLHAREKFARDSEMGRSGTVKGQRGDSSYPEPAGSVAGAWDSYMTWVNHGETPVLGWVSSPWYWCAIPALGVKRGLPRVEYLAEQARLRGICGAATVAGEDPQVAPRDPTWWYPAIVPGVTRLVGSHTRMSAWLYFQQRQNLSALRSILGPKLPWERFALLASTGQGVPIERAVHAFLVRMIGLFCKSEQVKSADDGSLVVAMLPRAYPQVRMACRGSDLLISPDVIPGVLTFLGLLPRCEDPPGSDGRRTVLTIEDLAKRGWQTFLINQFDWVRHGRVLWLRVTVDLPVKIPEVTWDVIEDHQPFGPLSNAG